MIPEEIRYIIFVSSSTSKGKEAGEFSRLVNADRWELLYVNTEGIDQDRRLRRAWA